MFRSSQMKEKDFGRNSGIEVAEILEVIFEVVYVEVELVQ